MIRISNINSTGPVEVLLFASAGGHLDQLLQVYKKLNADCLLVVDDKISEDTTLDLRYITLNTSERYFIWMNLFQCVRIMKKTKPKVFISTGSGSAIIFNILSIFFGTKTIFIESVARIKTLSLTGTLSKKVVNKFYVQWPELAQIEKIEYCGRVKFDE